jgi:hypothetical protein
MDVRFQPCIGTPASLQALSSLVESTRFSTSTMHRLNSLGYVGVAPRLRLFLNKLISGAWVTLPQQPTLAAEMQCHVQAPVQGLTSSPQLLPNAGSA